MCPSRTEPESGETTGVDIVYRQIRAEWADDLAVLERTAFPNIDPAHLYQADDLRALAETFPDGGFVTFDGDRIVGMGLGVLLDFDFDHIDHSAVSIYSAHNPDGEWYYGTTIAVLSEYRGRGIGAELYVRRKEVVRRLNRKGIVAGGVLPGYADHKDQMSAEQYLAKVSAGELYDPTLTFQIANGFEAKAVLPDYMDDPSVGNNACLIVWHNPDHRRPGSG